MPFDRKTLVIPDETTFEEKTICIKGDVVIGNECIVEFGLKTNGRIFIGERVKIEGDIVAKGDIRVDLFSTLNGNVDGNSSVYLGEGTRIDGRLSVKRDLDVGKNVEITEGFEAKGWINIRTPIPLIIYLFIYLVELLKRGHSEEVDRILDELEDDTMIEVSETFFFLPNNSTIGQQSTINGNLLIGKNCRLLGNYRVKGNARIEDNSTMYGAIRATGKITIEAGVMIDGSIESDNDICLAKSHVGGDVRGKKIVMAHGTVINGLMTAQDGIKFRTRASKKMEEKVSRFQDNVDVVDEVAGLLE